jgi:hypothetical protein
MAETVLKLKKSYPKGGASYGIDGVRGSIYINKSMLAGDPPAEIHINDSDPSAFAAPGAGGSGPKVSDPERIAKMTEAAGKAELRAQKAAERAQKLKAKLEKAGVKAAEAEVAADVVTAEA